MASHPKAKTARRRGCAGILAALALLLPAATVGHEGATGIVKARMDMMKSLGQSTKILTAMYGEKIPLEPAVVENEARWIASQAQRMAKLFPKGSQNWPSEARPEIWQDWSAFQDLADDLAQKGEQLAKRAASAPPSETTADFRALVSICGSCHKKFRETQ